MPDYEALLREKDTEVRQVSMTDLEMAVSRAFEVFQASAEPQVIGGRGDPKQVILQFSKTLLPERIRRAREKAVFIISSEDKGTISVIAEVVRALPALIQAHRRHKLEEQIGKFVDLIIPPDPGDELVRRIEFDNALLRSRFLREWSTLTSKQVHEQSGNASKNVALTASRWRREKRIFGVRMRGVDRYPEFQFKDGRPMPVIGRVLKVFDDKLSSWQIAFWFVAENGWLDGKRPVDLLDTEADKVFEVAQREAGETVF